MDLSSFNSSPVDTGVATPNLTQLGINTAEVILGQIRSKINAKGRGDNPDLVSPELRKQNASKITISRGPTNHTKRPHNIRLVDIINDQFLDLYFVPQDFKYNTSTALVTIAAIAQNTPIYHFVGAADILEFTIDWYAQAEDSSDAITNAKWVESLSKGNGREGQHPVRFLFGDTAWNSATWVVAEASWTPSLPQRNNHHWFRQIYQTVKLYRIADTPLGYDEIRDLTT